MRHGGERVPEPSAGFKADRDAVDRDAVREGNTAGITGGHQQDCQMRGKYPSAILVSPGVSRMTKPLSSSRINLSSRRCRSVRERVSLVRLRWLATCLFNPGNEMAIRVAVAATRPQCDRSSEGG